MCAIYRFNASLVVCVRRACRSVDHRELSLTLTARYASLVRARRVVSIQKAAGRPVTFRKLIFANNERLALFRKKNLNRQLFNLSRL